MRGEGGREVAKRGMIRLVQYRLNSSIPRSALRWAVLYIHMYVTISPGSVKRTESQSLQKTTTLKMIYLLHQPGSSLPGVNACGVLSGLGSRLVIGHLPYPKTHIKTHKFHLQLFLSLF